MLRDPRVSKEKAGESAQVEAAFDGVRLADAARCEVYVCYEGPLGANLKTERGLRGDLFATALGKI